MKNGKTDKSKSDVWHETDKLKGKKSALVTGRLRMGYVESTHVDNRTPEASMCLLVSPDWPGCMQRNT